MNMLTLKKILDIFNDHYIFLNDVTFIEHHHVKIIGDKTFIFSIDINDIPTHSENGKSLIALGCWINEDGFWCYSN
jgi:hypothetical protein